MFGELWDVFFMIDFFDFKQVDFFDEKTFLYWEEDIPFL